MNTGILPFLIYVIQLRNAGGLDHSDGVTMLSAKIARAAHLDKDSEFMRNLDFAARVHDIGKMGISDAVAQKPGKYTKFDYFRVNAP